MIGTKNMNDTTIRDSEICHSILKTPIEHKNDEKADQEVNKDNDLSYRSQNEHVSLRIDGGNIQNMQFDSDEFLILHNEYGQITFDA